LFKQKEVAAMDYDVFISYSSEDRAFADGLCHNLESQDVKCWIAPRDILPGRSWRESIAKAVEATPFMALLFSTNSSNSEQVKKELGLADDYKKIVIPVRVENIKPVGEFAYELLGKHWLDAFGEAGQDHIQKASEYIAEQVKKLKGSVSGSPVLQAKGDEKLLNALKLAYTDGKITDAELDMINTLSMQEGIGPERLKELEAKVRGELAIKADDVPEPETASATETFEWPDVGIQFLQKVKALVGPKLPFEPEGVSNEDEEEEAMAIWWYVTEKHFFGAWLGSKRTSNVTLGWEFSTDNEKRDPLFRTIADNIKSMSVVPDAEEDDQATGYFFFPDGYLGVSSEKRIRIDDLANPKLLEETGAHLIAFIEKTWPVIRKHYGK